VHCQSNVIIYNRQNAPLHAPASEVQQRYYLRIHNIFDILTGVDKIFQLDATGRIFCSIGLKKEREKKEDSLY
jgi:predicted RNA-binding protein with RPS1 domain